MRFYLILAKCSERSVAKHVPNVPNVPHVPNVQNTNIVPVQDRPIEVTDWVGRALSMNVRDLAGPGWLVTLIKVRDLGEPGWPRASQ